MAAALAHLRAGRVPAAVSALREAARESPTSAPVHALLGRALALAGQPVAAAKAFATALSIEPDQADLHMARAEALMNCQAWPAAVAAFRQAGRLMPDNPAPFNGMGRALEAAGRDQLALSAYQRAVGTCPSDPAGYVNLGALLVRRGQLADAEVVLRRAVAVDPGLAVANLDLGLVLLHSGRPAESEPYLRTASEIDPDLVEASLNWGHALMRMGRVDEALSAYEHAAGIPGSPSAALTHVGMALRRLGRDDEAVAAFLKAIALQPDDATARHMLAALTGGAAPAAPVAYVRGVFDGVAEQFDLELVDRLGYRAPEALRRIIDEEAVDRERFRRALDVGCGTGLAGTALRERVVRLEGVDVSPAMLRVAAAKSVYDDLHEDEAVAFLRRAGPQYDLIVAADSLIYIGDLRDLARAVARRLTTDGLFAFTTERLDGDGYVLGRSGRFTHADAYVIAEMMDAGLAERRCEAITSRREGGADVDSSLFVFSRPAVR